MNPRDKAERNHKTNMVDVWQEYTMAGEMDWHYVCRMLLTLSGELGRKRTARLMYSMADQLHFDADVVGDVGVYCPIMSEENTHDSEKLAQLPKSEVRQMMRAVRKERRKLAEALIGHKERGKKVNWAKFGAMIDDLKYRLGPSDAGWLITELADHYGINSHYER